MSTAPCPAPLYATGFDKTDYADPLLRAFLLVSLMVSLALCGRELSNPPSRAVAQQTAATTPSVCCVTAAPRIKPPVL